MTPELGGDNHIANVDASAVALVRAKDGSVEDRGLVKPDRNNFAPRVGVTYTPSTAWVLRSGYGIFYNLYDRIGSEDQLSLNLPFLINNQRTATAAAAAPLFLLKNGFPADFLDPTKITVASVRVRAIY